MSFDSEFHVPVCYELTSYLFCFYSGEYSFCFENGMSLYSSKVIYFFLLSYTYADWTNYAEEIRGFHDEIQNVTVSYVV